LEEFILSKPDGLTGFQALVKRVFDILWSAGSILILSPIIIGVILAIKISSPGPLFFYQKRVGKDNQDFDMMKFRTMVVGAEKMGIQVGETDNRITGVGKFLRRFCLDELPQLFNVFGGNMSIVGPRPTLRYQVDKYTPEQMRRLLVKPGMTGLAQVKGRNQIPWEQRIKYDIAYIDRYSFWLDLDIIAQTFGLIAGGEGVYGEGGKIAEEKSVQTTEVPK